MSEFSYEANVPFNGDEHKVTELRLELAVALSNADGWALTVRHIDDDRLAVSFRMPAVDEQDALSRSEEVMFVVFPRSSAFAQIVSPVAPEA